jgi:hypothetical protein
LASIGALSNVLVLEALRISLACLSFDFDFVFFTDPSFLSEITTKLFDPTRNPSPFSKIRGEPLVVVKCTCKSEQWDDRGQLVEDDKSGDMGNRSMS